MPNGSLGEAFTGCPPPPSTLHPHLGVILPLASCSPCGIVLEVNPSLRSSCPDALGVLEAGAPALQPVLSGTLARSEASCRSRSFYPLCPRQSLAGRPSRAAGQQMYRACWAQAGGISSERSVCSDLESPSSCGLSTALVCCGGFSSLPPTGLNSGTDSLSAR